MKGSLNSHQITTNSGPVSTGINRTHSSEEAPDSCMQEDGAGRTRQHQPSCFPHRRTHSVAELGELLYRRFSFPLGIPFARTAAVLKQRCWTTASSCSTRPKPNSWGIMGCRKPQRHGRIRPSDKGKLSSKLEEKETPESC